jgi:hypothetical protein
MDSSSLRAYLCIHKETLENRHAELTNSELESSIFGDITPCSQLNANRRYGGTCRFHLQSRKVSQVEPCFACCLHHAGFSLFNTEDGGDIFFRNVG